MPHAHATSSVSQPIALASAWGNKVFLCDARAIEAPLFVIETPAAPLFPFSSPYRLAYVALRHSGSNIMANGTKLLMPATFLMCSTDL